MESSVSTMCKPASILFSHRAAALTDLPQRGQISAPPHLGLAAPEELGPETFLTTGAATEDGLTRPPLVCPLLSTASVAPLASRLLLLLSVRGAFFGATYAAAWWSTFWPAVWKTSSCVMASINLQVLRRVIFSRIIVQLLYSLCIPCRRPC